MEITPFIKCVIEEKIKTKLLQEKLMCSEASHLQANLQVITFDKYSCDRYKSL
jgi:hypothetical protein